MFCLVKLTIEFIHGFKKCVCDTKKVIETGQICLVRHPRRLNKS